MDLRTRFESGLVEDTIRAIPGFSDYYCSRSGNIFSTKRALVERKPLTALRGYKTISLTKDSGIVVRTGVHSLVMLTFVGPRPNRHDVAHLDNNPQNNELSNLKYCTRLENESHKCLFGTRPKGYTHALAKLTYVQVNFIRTNDNIKTTDLAAKFEVSVDTIARVRANKIYIDQNYKKPKPLGSRQAISCAVKRIND